MNNRSPEPVTTDSGQITKIAREEIEKNNRILEFIQNQIDKDRTFFKHLYWVATSFLLLLVAAAGYFGYSSVSQMRSDLQSAFDTELRHEKQAIADLTADEARSVEITKKRVADELNSVRGEMEMRVATEFRDPHITSVIEDAARQRTQFELSEIIQTEVRDQVAHGISQQRDFIKSEIESQTKSAVALVQPYILNSIQSSTKMLMKESLDPIDAALKNYKDLIFFELKSSYARNDDRFSFDYIVRTASGQTDESSDDLKHQIAFSTWIAVILTQESYLAARVFSTPVTPETMKKLMISDPNILNRLTAIIQYPANDSSVLPYLVDVITRDSSTMVLYQAVSRFDKLCGQNFQFWEENNLLDWWDRKQHSSQ